MPALSTDIGIEAKVAHLQAPESYSEPVERVEAIETHMAWVFLTDRHAYKMKKPVRLGGMDFRTLTARRRACRSELVLNRRLAPDVYLGLRTLRIDPAGHLALGPEPPDAYEGDVVEWLVQMRRLPDERLLDVALDRGTATPADLRPVGALLARFYRNAAPVRLRTATYRRWLREDVYRNRMALIRAGHPLSRHRIEAVADALSAALRRRAGQFNARVQEGHVVDGHGDLRPEHVCLESPPVIIDCLEFSRALRLLDPVDELAFLALECKRLGAPWAGQVVLDAYQAGTEDAPPEALRTFYACRNAYQRARLAVRHLTTHDTRAAPAVWMAQAQDYLDHAVRQLPALRAWAD
jgi:aminoglycoside phosphotransferase family enzyme